MIYNIKIFDGKPSPYLGSLKWFIFGEKDGNIWTEKSERLDLSLWLNLLFLDCFSFKSFIFIMYKKFSNIVKF